MLKILFLLVGFAAIAIPAYEVGHDYRASR
jgi:hypothetical protein